MRTTATTFILLSLLLCSRVEGQQTISEITSNSKEVTANLSAAFDLDVIQYYQLDDEYNTDLKKSVFKKSQEYQNYLAQLKAIKLELPYTMYYTAVDNVFKDCNYNTRLGGFEYQVGKNYYMPIEGWGRPPKSVGLSDGEIVVLKSLPSIKIPNKFYNIKDVYDEVLFFPINESDGLEIENDKENDNGNITAYFFFIPSGEEKFTFKFLNEVTPRPFWINKTESHLKSEMVRIVVANKSTGKIYFDKSYPANTNAKSSNKGLN